MLYPIPPTGPGRLPPAGGAAASRLSRPLQADTPVTSQLSEVGDRVELSEVAVIVAKLSGTPPERLAKILAIKREIDQGTYITEARLREALTRMIDTLSARNLRK